MTRIPYQNLSTKRPLLVSLFLMVTMAVLVIITGCYEEKSTSKPVDEIVLKEVIPSMIVRNVETKDVSENPQSYLNQRINFTVTIFQVGGPCPDGIRSCRNINLIIDFPIEFRDSRITRDFILIREDHSIIHCDIAIVRNRNAVALDPICTAPLLPSREIKFEGETVQASFSTTASPKQLAMVTGYLTPWKYIGGGDLIYSYDYGFVVESYEFLG